jgi:hypothetical protein
MWNGYLSHERRVVAVLEIFGENSFRKEFFIGDNESYSVGGPLDAHIILNLLI